MVTKKDFILDEATLSKIINFVDSFTTDKNYTLEDYKLQYENIKSCWVICKYSMIIHFKNFYFIKYFNKIFIFNDTIEMVNIKKIVTDNDEFKNLVSAHAIGLIVDDKLISNYDFMNLKKCYMLTEVIDFKDQKIYCKYYPYYLIELQLEGDLLTITIKVVNSQCELNMINVDTDLKSFLRKVFENMDKSSLKIYHQILEYYANL